MTTRQDNSDPNLIHAFATGKTVAAAAAEAGVSERTAFRRLQDPDVQRQIDERRAYLTEVAVDRLVNAADPVCANLNKLALEGKTENVQIAAGRTVLDRLVKLQNVYHLEARMRDLESKLARQPAIKATSYWPPSLEHGPPCVDGLEPQDGYRLIAIWLSYQVYKGGLPEEQVQDLKQQIADMRKNARHYDEVMDAPDHQPEA